MKVGGILAASRRAKLPVFGPCNERLRAHACRRYGVGASFTGNGRSWAGRTLRGALALLLVGLAYLVLPAIPAHASCDGDQPFMVTATAANTSGYIMTIDNAEINGFSAAVPFVSQLYT